MGSNSRAQSRESKSSSDNENQRYHMSNIYLTDVDQSVSGQSRIKIQMQPSKHVRCKEEISRDTKVLLTREVCERDFKETSAVLSTFKSGSSALRALEQTHLFSDGLIMRDVVNEETGESQTLLDLDSEQGIEVTKTYLFSLERLMISLGLVLSSRAYRDAFSNSYKVLYRQMKE